MTTRLCGLPVMRANSFCASASLMHPRAMTICTSVQTLPMYMGSLGGAKAPPPPPPAASGGIVVVVGGVCVTRCALCSSALTLSLSLSLSLLSLLARARGGTRRDVGPPAGASLPLLVSLRRARKRLDTKL
jgi:hypothetical protein